MTRVQVFRSSHATGKGLNERVDEWIRNSEVDGLHVIDVALSIDDGFTVMSVWMNDDVVGESLVLEEGSIFVVNAAPGTHPAEFSKMTKYFEKKLLDRVPVDFSVLVLPYGMTYGVVLPALEKVEVGEIYSERLSNAFQMVIEAGQAPEAFIKGCEMLMEKASIDDSSEYADTLVKTYEEMKTVVKKTLSKD